MAKLSARGRYEVARWRKQDSGVEYALMSDGNMLVNLGGGWKKTGTRIRGVLNDEKINWALGQMAQRGYSLIPARVRGQLTRMNPRPSRSRYTHVQIKPAAYFDSRSFRTVTPKAGRRLTVGCRKGYWDAPKQRCKRGMELQRAMIEKGTPDEIGAIKRWKERAKEAQRRGKKRKVANPYRRIGPMDRVVAFIARHLADDQRAQTYAAGYALWLADAIKKPPPEKIVPTVKRKAIEATVREIIGAVNPTEPEGWKLSHREAERLADKWRTGGPSQDLPPASESPVRGPETLPVLRLRTWAKAIKRAKAAQAEGERQAAATFARIAREKVEAELRALDASTKHITIPWKDSMGGEYTFQARTYIDPITGEKFLDVLGQPNFAGGDVYVPKSESRTMSQAGMKLKFLAYSSEPGPRTGYGPHTSFKIVGNPLTRRETESIGMKSQLALRDARIAERRGDKAAAHKALGAAEAYEDVAIRYAEREMARRNPKKQRVPRVVLPVRHGDTVFHTFGTKLLVVKMAGRNSYALKLAGASRVRWGNAREAREDIAHFAMYGVLPGPSGESWANPRRRNSTTALARRA